jgi:tRNA-binding protein
VRSEVLTLGTYSSDVVLLVDPGAEAQPGDRLG